MNKLSSKINRLLKENRGFIVFIVLMSVFRSAVADWNTVPTGSMKPTIVEGDRILVNKMAYDVRVPFTHISLAHVSDPKAGDIVIFDSEVADKRLVKRVIGVPGDKVSLYQNQLTINGEALSYQVVAEHKNSQRTFDFEEELAGAKHQVRLTDNNSYPLANFNTVVVPPNHYLVLGDNRDNSADSRVIGFVPRTEIVGRSSKVVMSFNYDNYYIPRSNRFWLSI